MNFPEIVDIALPTEGVFHNLVFVSIRKTHPMQPYKFLRTATMHGLWGVDQMMFTKYIIVVVDDECLRTANRHAQTEEICRKGDAHFDKQSAGILQAASGDPRVR